MILNEIFNEKRGREKGTVRLRETGNKKAESGISDGRQEAREKRNTFIR